MRFLWFPLEIRIIWYVPVRLKQPAYSRKKWAYPRKISPYSRKKLAFWIKFNVEISNTLTAIALDTEISESLVLCQ